MNTSRRSSLLSFLTFSHAQESIECIYYRVTTGIEWCLEDLSFAEEKRREEIYRRSSLNCE